MPEKTRFTSLHQLADYLGLSISETRRFVIEARDYSRRLHYSENPPVSRPDFFPLIRPKDEKSSGRVTRFRVENSFRKMVATETGTSISTSAMPATLHAKNFIKNLLRL